MIRFLYIYAERERENVRERFFYALLKIVHAKIE
jgi:DNA invertase Pin-like site-specific DNA recombinase